MHVHAHSVADIRRTVDCVKRVLFFIVDDSLNESRVFRAAAAQWLAMISAAAAIKLSNFRVDRFMREAVLAAVGDLGVLHGGSLLLDVRKPGDARDLRLRMAMLLISHDIGSVGIVQDARDEVHHLTIDDTPPPIKDGKASCFTFSI